LRDDTVGGNTSGDNNSPAPSDWFHLRFEAGAIEGSCQLTNCDIRYGGRFDHVLWSRHEGTFTALGCQFSANARTVRMEDGGESTMTNCTMEPSTDGVAIYYPTTGAQITNCTITQGDGYPAYLPMSSVQEFFTSQNNSFIPRGDEMWNAIGITSSTISESMTLPVLPHDFVYYLNYSTVTVGGINRPILTINPGTVLKNYRSAIVFGINTANPGGINAQGATFTSIYDDFDGGDTSGNATNASPADWKYLRFNESSTIINCILVDCDIRYGGRLVDGSVYSQSGAAFVLNKVRISHSSSAGLFATGTDSRPRAYYCEFTDNVDGIRAMNNARPDLTRSCFENNSDFALELDPFTDGEGDLFAQECWWGTPSGPVVGSDISDNVDFANWATLATCLDPSAVGELPLAFKALAPFPNPFNPSTEIQFELPRTESVTLRIFDVRGRMITSLIQGDSFSAGRHAVTWNGRNNAGMNVPSGVYFYVLEAGGNGARHKMLLLK
ncbi:MAG: T9SS type A sorting domain-containing protein, partial [bacterium]|nr:T9SS type A sorting domain-containing protein [bacterium]